MGPVSVSRQREGEAEDLRADVTQHHEHIGPVTADRQGRCDSLLTLVVGQGGPCPARVMMITVMMKLVIMMMMMMMAVVVVVGG